MASIRELRSKVKSVKSTQQITKAMKLVSAARLNKAQERIVSARPFANKLESLLQDLAYLINVDSREHVVHPLMKERTSNRLDVVLVTSDRGLCGGFNANLIRKTVQFIREHQDTAIHLWLIGKKGRDFFRRISKNIEKEYVGLFQNLNFAQAELVGNDLIEIFLKTDTRGVVFIYNEFKSRMSQELVIKPLLPMAQLPAVKPTLDFIYEPSREELVEELLPRYIKGQIFRILLESQAAELAARMAAMDNATNNAREMISSLMLTMNKARQASITKELAEIVSGAEALQN